MWTPPERLLPAADVVVAALDKDGIYYAKRPMQEPESEWFECTAFGDPIWEENTVVVREPQYWCHVPRSVGALSHG